MDSQKPKAGPPVPPHLASAGQLQLLQERVRQKYGAFGAREPSAEETDQRVFQDNFFKPALRIIGGIALASAVASVVSHPKFAAPGMWANSFRIDTALAFLWAPLLYWAMARQRLGRSLRVYLVLALFIEPFSEVMLRDMGVGDERGYWDTIMWPAAVAFFGTLKEFAGIPGASVGVFFLVTVYLLYRAVTGKKGPDYTPPPRVARTALLTFLGGVLALALFGVVRGGMVEWTFRQTIYLIQLPLVAFLFLYALRVPDDLAAVGTIYVTAAVARSLLVVWVYFGVCMPQGITQIHGKPEWCTNHSDTVLFVTALTILVAHALEQRKKKIIVRALGLSAIILIGIVLNNRRLAFVSMAAAPLVLYLAMKPSKRKRQLTAALAIFVPLLTCYVLIGSEATSTSPLLKPAKLVVSVLDQKDTSSQSRDIENENLIYTLRQSPFVTKGFGFEYDYSPSSPPVDLGDQFKNYRLIAHNGVLWLWSVAGLVGFAIVWLVYPLAGTFALRGYRNAMTPLERSAALASLGAVVVCVMQIWGDQGFNSYMTLLTFGLAFAVAARLAARQAT